MCIPCYRDNKVPKKSDSRHSSGKRMLFLFPCGCEADSSAPAEPTFSMLTRETSSTVGSENWGTLTETLPMMLFLKWSWNWSLKQQERKIYQDQHLSHNLANLYQYTIHVKKCCFLNTSSAVFTHFGVDSEVSSAGKEQRGDVTEDGICWDYTAILLQSIKFIIWQRSLCTVYTFLWECLLKVFQ